VAWSLNASPASIEANSITHAPSSGEVRLPTLSLILIAHQRRLSRAVVRGHHFV